jgi:enoyl-CoA hydratase
LRDAIRDAGSDDAVDAVILTGTDPAFCLGDDIDEIGSAEPDVSRLINEAIFLAPLAWEAIDKPVIGAINGAAERGGLEIALQCDFLIASERATFRDVHVHGGVVPAWALSATLPAAVGRATALRMCLTGAPIDASRALIAGLVTEVVAHDELMPTTLRVVADIAAADRAAVRNLLATFRRGGPLADATALEHELAGHMALLEETGRHPSVLEVLRQTALRRGLAP